MALLNVKYTWLILLFLNSSIACRQPQNSSLEDNTNKSIQKNSSDTNIAIIHYDKSIYWLFDGIYEASVLTKADLIEIDKLFTESIADHNSKLTNSNKENFFIDLGKMNYKRQYVCVTNMWGQKEVYINCFCETFDFKWKESLMVTDDGGSCYFNFKLNLVTKKYYNFFVNSSLVY